MISPFIPHLVSEGISYGLSSFGYDVRIGSHFSWINLGSFCRVVDPKDVNLGDVWERSSFDEKIDIPAGGFVLGTTVEKICLPENVFCLCIGKSTYARCGLIVNVTPIEPGWSGHITVEITNTAPRSARVYVGEGIMQLVFFKVDERPDFVYSDRGGKYQDQPPFPVLPRTINPS
jgi:dCTP deaminase